MRTDSVQVSQEALAQVRDFIAQTYGRDQVPEKPNLFTSRVKNAQEAHEAIRPTSAFRTPGQLKPHLSPEQHRLYSLIWQRFVASQMVPAVLETTSVDILPYRNGKATAYRFRASATRVKEPGFYQVYRDDEEEEGESRKALPALTEGETLHLHQLWPEQHFTQPPPRYTEASLIKALEEQGIGRPSTYAPILSVIQERNYVTREGRTLQPTELGMVVSDMLVTHFPEVMDIGFTVQMEEDLDAISRGEKGWVPVLQEFYRTFAERLARADQEAEKVEVQPEETGELCELCGKPLIIRTGRFGKFIGCSGFPACRNTKPYYERTGITCPKCGQGEVVRKRARSGSSFYGCTRYPDCDYTTRRPPAQVGQQTPAQKPEPVAP